MALMDKKAAKALMQTCAAQIDNLGTPYQFLNDAPTKN